jgi:hypothetical protein
VLILSFPFQSNAKSPDVPGGTDITTLFGNVSSRSQEKVSMRAVFVGWREAAANQVERAQEPS